MLRSPSALLQAGACCSGMELLEPPLEPERKELTPTQGCTGRGSARRLEVIPRDTKRNPNAHCLTYLLCSAQGHFRVSRPTQHL